MKFTSKIIESWKIKSKSENYFFFQFSDLITQDSWSDFLHVVHE